MAHESYEAVRRRLGDEGAARRELAVICDVGVLVHTRRDEKLKAARRRYHGYPNVRGEIAKLRIRDRRYAKPKAALETLEAL